MKLRTKKEGKPTHQPQNPADLADRRRPSRPPPLAARWACLAARGARAGRALGAPGRALGAPGRSGRRPTCKRGRERGIWGKLREGEREGFGGSCVREREREIHESNSHPPFHIEPYK